MNSALGPILTPQVLARSSILLLGTLLSKLPIYGQLPIPRRANEGRYVL